MRLKTFISICLLITGLILINAGIAYLIVTQFPAVNSVPTEAPPDLSGRILWHGNPGLKEVALTFDDGPSSIHTPRILDILGKFEVKATFFVLGKNIEKNWDILMREALEGHSIGNHTFSHSSGLMTDIGKIKAELASTNTLIKKYTGKTTGLFRPPFGFENWRFYTEAELMDYRIVLWTLDVADWNHEKNEPYMVSKILKNTRNGTIIMLHDNGTSREAMVSALPKIITGLRKKGYSFVTIDEMIAHL